MRVFPDAKAQTLAQCEAGQLVRSLEYGEADQLGIVFDAREREDELRGIVTLTGDVPVFEVEQQPGQMFVLAYSGAAVWDVDQKGPLETNARVLFDKSGALISDKDGWFLNVASAQGYGVPRTRMQFNLLKGVLDRYRERLNKVAIFGAWTLFLEEPDRPYSSRLEIASFRIDSEA